MAFTDLPVVKLMGFVVTGDVAGYTCYTSQRRQLVIYPQAPPLSPASPDQAAVRGVMRYAAIVWRSNTPEFRNTWCTAATKAKLGMGGFALLFTWYMKKERGTFLTIERQTGIQLLATISEA